MQLLFFPLLLIWFIGVMKAGFDYVTDLHKKELEALTKKTTRTKDKALKIECRKVRKFLNPDGSVNIQAAKNYLKQQEQRARSGAQYIEFTEVK